MLTTRGPGVYPGSPSSITVVVTGAITLFGTGPAPVLEALIAWPPVQYLGDLFYHRVEQPARHSNRLSRSPRPGTSGAVVEPASVDVREVRDGADEQAVQLRADDPLGQPVHRCRGLPGISDRGQRRRSRQPTRGRLIPVGDDLGRLLPSGIARRDQQRVVGATGGHEEPVGRVGERK